MGIPVKRVDGGQRGTLAVWPHEAARLSRKVECPGCGKRRPKSWLNPARRPAANPAGLP